MAAPVITQQPVNITTGSGTVATFTGKATGATSADLYKLVPGNSSGGVLYGSNVPDGTGTVSIFIPAGNESALSPTYNGSYELIFRNTNDNPATYTVSSAVTLTVLPPPPVITTQPVALTIAAGQNARFSFAATGATSSAWQKDGVPLVSSLHIVGTTTTTLSIVSAQPADAGFYAGVATNSGGATPTASVQLTVAGSTGAGGAGGFAIEVQPVSTTVVVGATAELSVEADGATSYQWLKDGVAVTGSRFTGAQGATLTISAAVPADYGSYSCKASKGTTSVTSVAVTLFVVASIPGGGTTSGATDWTISVGGKAYPASALGISEITRSRASQTTDTCTLTVDGRNVDAPALFVYKTALTVSRGGTPWFAGIVTELPASGSAAAQAHTYTLSGPWWYLENLVFTQTWQVQNGTASRQLGRAILGMDINGNAVPTGEVIHEALGYAIQAGAPFVVGDVLGGFTIPFDEVKDVTCAEVVRKMLRWHPDAVAWFDYSYSPPAIFVRSRSALAAATLTLGQKPLASIGKITPKPELQAPEVVIAYELTKTANGKTTADVQYDSAPVGATGKTFGAVVLTIPLRGQSSTTVNQPVIVTPIVDDPDDPDVVPFLVAQYGGELADAANDPDIGVDGITITDISRDLQDPNAVEYDPDGGTDDDGNPSTVPVEYDDSLGNMLIQGAISQDMVQQFNLKAQAQRITFKYTLDSGSGDSDDPSGSDYSDVSDERTATLDIMATNAVSQPYTTLTSYDTGDQVPTGLAASYLATLSALQWAGSVTLEEQLAGATIPVGLGNLLNIAGSQNPAWASMNALVVQEQVQASTGRTTLTFGPSKHLTPNEMVARLRTTRPGGMGGRASTGARGTDRSDERSSGAPSDANSIGGGVHNAYRNSTLVPPESSAEPGSPTPFQFVQQGANTNSFLLNANSYFRADGNSTTSTPMTNSTTALTLTAGDVVWLQLDASDGGYLQEASIVSGSTPPFQASGQEVATAAGDGGGQVWDVSYYLLAQVYAADASGQPTRGGIVYTVDSQNPPTQIEVVQRATTHLVLEQVFCNGALAYQAFPGSAPLLSDD